MVKTTSLGNTIHKQVNYQELTDLKYKVLFMHSSKIID